MTSQAAPTGIIAGVERGEFCITLDFESRLLINSIRGPSPPNTFIMDWVLDFNASFVAFCSKTVGLDYGPVYIGT